MGPRPLVEKYSMQCPTHINTTFQTKILLNLWLRSLIFYQSYGFKIYLWRVFLRFIRFKTQFRTHASLTSHSAKPSSTRHYDSRIGKPQSLSSRNIGPSLEGWGQKQRNKPTDLSAMPKTLYTHGSSLIVRKTSKRTHS